MDIRNPRDCLENKANTLLCSAFDGEIDLLLTSGRFPHLKSLGIGNLEAALSLQDYLNQNHEIVSVIFLGSCGVYPWSRLLGEEIVSTVRTHHLEISASLGQSKQIQFGKSSIDFLFPNLVFPKAVCNAPTTLTLLDLKSPPTAEWEEVDIENLELYGIARVCEIRKISLTAHLAVTNVVGSEGSLQWQKNWRGLSNRLQNHFLAL